MNERDAQEQEQGNQESGNEQEAQADQVGGQIDRRQLV